MNKCKRCGSENIEYHDNYITGVTTTECNDCDFLDQSEDDA